MPISAEYREFSKEYLEGKEVKTIIEFSGEELTRQNLKKIMDLGSIYCFTPADHEEVKDKKGRVSFLIENKIDGLRILNETKNILGLEIVVSEK